MLPPVYQTLAAAGAVTAIVSQRIYGSGEAPQGTTVPYLTWVSFGASPENELSDVPGIDKFLIQIDAYAATEAGVRDLAAAVRAAVEPHAHCVGMTGDGRDQDTRLFRIALEFDWWFGR